MAKLRSMPWLVQSPKGRAAASAILREPWADFASYVLTHCDGWQMQECFHPCVPHPQHASPLLHCDVPKPLSWYTEGREQNGYARRRVRARRSLQGNKPAATKGRRCLSDASSES